MTDKQKKIVMITTIQIAVASILFISSFYLIKKSK